MKFPINYYLKYESVNDSEPFSFTDVYSVYMKKGKPIQKDMKVIEDAKKITIKSWQNVGIEIKFTYEGFKDPDLSELL